MHQAQTRLQARVIAAAGAAFAQRGAVTPIDVLVGVGWLQPARLEDWRKGRVPYLEAVVIAGLGKISKAMRYFRQWARRAGLQPKEMKYQHRSRRLRFSKSGSEAIERAYRTQWTAATQPRRRQARDDDDAQRRFPPARTTAPSGPGDGITAPEGRATPASRGRPGSRGAAASSRNAEPCVAATDPPRPAPTRNRVS